MEANLINAGALAYLGDSVYEVEIRNYLVLKGINNANKLQKEARNYKPNSKPKHTDIVTYKKATALEALFGMLYINKNTNRIKELIKLITMEW